MRQAGGPSIMERMNTKVALRVAAMLAASGCAGPPITLRVQGTVHSVGTRTPIPGASVLIEWPPTLGGGQSELKSDAEGHFAVGRRLRTRKPICAGLALTVQAPRFASAYTRHGADCEHNVLSFDVALLPQIR